LSGGVPQHPGQADTPADADRSSAHDREFTQARLAEIRALLDSAGQLGDGVAIQPIPIVEGYGAWAEANDQPGNQLIDLEQPIVWEILDGLPRGTALARLAAPAVMPSIRPHGDRR
jgi:hypothetical protein